MTSMFPILLLVVVTVFVSFLYLVVCGVVRRLDVLEARSPGHQGRPPRLGAGVGESVVLPDGFRQLVMKMSPDGSPIVVLFVQEDCQPCSALFKDLNEGDPIDLPPMVLVVPSDHSDHLAIRQTRSEVATFVDASRDVALAFRTEVAPHAFVFDSRSSVVLGEDLVGTADHLLTLIKRAGIVGFKEEVSA